MSQMRIEDICERPVAECAAAEVADVLTRSFECGWELVDTDQPEMVLEFSGSESGANG